MALHGADHGGLRGGGLVVVDHAAAAEELDDTRVGMGTSIDTEGELTAMCIAMSVSVTVSIGELMKGVLRTTLRVILLSVTTCCAAKSILPGRMRKSLYVRPP